MALAPASSGFLRLRTGRVCWTEYSENSSWPFEYEHTRVLRKLAMTIDTVIRVVLLTDWGGK